MDIDNSGLLDFDEFAGCCSRLGLGEEDVDVDINEQFQKMDKDQTGFIDYGEFRQCILGEKVQKLSVNKLRTVFSEADFNDSGALDFEQFANACNWVQFGTLQTEDLRAHFDRVDLDKSGAIDFNEFVFCVLGKANLAPVLTDAEADADANEEELEASDEAFVDDEKQSGVSSPTTSRSSWFRKSSKKSSTKQLDMAGTLKAPAASMFGGVIDDVLRRPECKHEFNAVHEAINALLRKALYVQHLDTMKEFEQIDAETNLLLLMPKKKRPRDFHVRLEKIVKKRMLLFAERDIKMNRDESPLPSIDL